MPTPLANAVNSLMSALKAAAGVEITYSRGVSEIIINAIPGNTLSESTFADGSVRTTRIADFIVQIADLGLTPQRGDRIDWDGRRYEVRHPGDGRVFEEVGPYKQSYRVHTVEVNVS